MALLLTCILPPFLYTNDSQAVQANLALTSPSLLDEVNTDQAANESQ